MNKRIRELAFQAMSINQKVSDDSFFVEVSKLNEFEKFAQLIVRECSWTVRMTEFGDNMTQEQIARYIEDHFRVEE
jgi:hypothetical protein